VDACDYEGSLPLYLRYKDPTCAPILSQNALSGNVLLKITVPRRTGRKRKRGSNELFMDIPNGSEPISEEEQNKGHTPDLLSFGRNDQTKSLLRRLRDNQGRYEIEPVGTIEQTHRYRGMDLTTTCLAYSDEFLGLSDFNYSTRHQKFMTKFRDTVLTGNSKFFLFLIFKIPNLLS
jgi:general transcription factor 3C polypeptide 5 (transcription factor C subunit 1)